MQCSHDLSTASRRAFGMSMKPRKIGASHRDRTGEIRANLGVQKPDMRRTPPTKSRTAQPADLSPTTAPYVPIRPVQRRLLMPLAIVLLLLVGGSDALLLKMHHADQEQKSQLILEGASVELNESLTEQSETLEAIEMIQLCIRDVAVRSG